MVAGLTLQKIDPAFKDSETNRAIDIFFFFFPEKAENPFNVRAEKIFIL